MSGMVVLISGRGSNLAAMCETSMVKQIKCVISNKADVPGLDIAKKYNIPFFIIEHKQYKIREEFDKQIAKIIDSYQPQYIILAGFMRILSSWFVNYYSMRLVNIHPSILPAFIGADAINQTFAAKVKISGITIHFVTDKLDHGPIIAQGVISALPCKTVDDLAQRTHKLEHIVYPFIINKLLNNKVSFDKNNVIVEKENSDLDALGEFSGCVFY